MEFEDEIKMVLSVEKQEVKRGGQQVAAPKLKVQMMSLKESYALKCESRDDLCQVKTLLASDFISKVFPIEQSQFFDRVSAARLITGFIQAFNELTVSTLSSSYFNINAEKGVANIALNCRR